MVQDQDDLPEGDFWMLWPAKLEKRVRLDIFAGMLMLTCFRAIPMNRPECSENRRIGLDLQITMN